MTKIFKHFTFIMKIVRKCTSFLRKNLFLFVIYKQNLNNINTKEVKTCLNQIKKYIFFLPAYSEPP